MTPPSQQRQALSKVEYEGSGTLGDDTSRAPPVKSVSLQGDTLLQDATVNTSADPTDVNTDWIKKLDEVTEAIVIPSEKADAAELSSELWTHQSPAKKVRLVLNEFLRVLKSLF